MANDSREVDMFLLQQNFRDVQWVKDLDQKLAYYPFLAGGALVALSRGDVRGTALDLLTLLGGATVALILLGLIRNHIRHSELLRARAELLRSLGSTAPSPSRDLAFWLGRPVYALLLIAGALVAYVASRPGF